MYLYFISSNSLRLFYVQFYLSFQDKHFGGRSGIIKVILLTLSIFVTTYIFRSCKEFQSEKIKLLLKLRMTIFFYALIFAFVGFYELWGRVIFVFYFIDLLLITHIAFKTLPKNTGLLVHLLYFLMLLHQMLKIYFQANAMTKSISVISVTKNNNIGLYQNIKVYK